MLKRLLLLSLMSTQVALTLLPSIAKEQPDIVCRDNDFFNQDTYLPGYANCERQLKNLAPELSSASFFVLVGSDGVGHLQSKNPGSNSLRKPLYKETNLMVWEQRVSFYQPGKGWHKLKLDEAKLLFGQPDKRASGKSVFYTFHVLTAPDTDEQQLYHLDIKFDAGNSITSYRVRGIGMNNPKWISS